MDKINLYILLLKKTDAFSAHPDHNGLKKFITNSVSERTKRVFLVHGDLESSQALKDDLDLDIIEVAQKGVEVVL